MGQAPLQLDYAFAKVREAEHEVCHNWVRYIVIGLRQES